MTDIKIDLGQDGATPKGTEFTPEQANALEDSLVNAVGMADTVDALQEILGNELRRSNLSADAVEALERLCEQSEDFKAGLDSIPSLQASEKIEVPAGPNGKIVAVDPHKIMDAAVTGLETNIKDLDGATISYDPEAVKWNSALKCYEQPFTITRAADSQEVSDQGAQTSRSERPDPSKALQIDGAIFFRGREAVRIALQDEKSTCTVATEPSVFTDKEKIIPSGIPKDETVLYAAEFSTYSSDSNFIVITKAGIPGSEDLIVRTGESSTTFGNQVLLQVKEVFIDEGSNISEGTIAASIKISERVKLELNISDGQVTLSESDGIVDSPRDKNIRLLQRATNNL